jgi:hypothetical protein
VCAGVGVRSLDTYDALVSRIRDRLFERMYADEPSFARAVAAADPKIIADVLQKAKEADEDPASILGPPDANLPWLTRSEAWIYDARMPSHVGYVKRSHVGRIVDFARWTGILLPTLDLSEEGMLLQILTQGADFSAEGTNPLYVGSRLALRLLYARLLLRSEVLYVSLLCEMAERTANEQRMSTRGPDGLLRHAVERLQRAIGEPTDPEDILTYRVVEEFKQAFLRSLSTEENYFRPRIENLVDLGLVTRRVVASGDKPGAFPWCISEAGIAVAAAWQEIDKNPLRIDEFLETELIGSMIPLASAPLRRVTNERERLLWFARAYKVVHREIGFTPGRTVSQMASMLAAEGGMRLELSELFEAVYESPRGDFAPHFSFSGGSRFDSEFMIKIDDTLLPTLEAACGVSPNRI